MEFNCRKTAKQIAKEFFLCVLVSNWELKANCVAIQLKFTFSPIFSRISSPQTPSPQTMCWRDGEEKVLWMRTKKKILVKSNGKSTNFPLSIFCTYFTPVENSISLQLSLLFRPTRFDCATRFSDAASISGKLDCCCCDFSMAFVELFASSSIDGF